MKTLILSNTTYSWVKYCVGTILRDSVSIQMIIVNKDDDRPLYRMTSLCEEAVYAQRTYDLFRLGKLLGIKKISNLGYSKDNLDIEKLSAQNHVHADGQQERRGAGTVVSSPSGISCGRTCSRAFNEGTTVTLSATPAARSAFYGWSGACTGLGSCTVPMDMAKTLSAAFGPP